MIDASPIAHVVYSWELPLAIDDEGRAVDSVAEYGRRTGVDPEDFALVLEEATERWKLSGTVDPLLSAAVDEALNFTPRVLSAIDARAYYEMHKKLLNGSSDVASLTHSLSRRLLSRAPLIAHMLAVERFSCTQVARLLAATDASLDVPHGAISVIARKLRLQPTLARDAAGRELWDSDQRLSIALFPDSTVAETNNIAGEEARTWLPEVNVESLLRKLSRSDQPNGEPFWPYLQMLHWCLTPIEFYDHPASYLYEFAPRGSVGLELFSRYPTATGNPVLNNAKAVQTLNSSWARNRGGDDAHALVSLLESIESLPFVPRRQIARTLRAWLIRLIDLRTVDPIPLEVEPTDELFIKVARFVAHNETYTQGVIEQRVVDALAVLAFGKPDWRPKGLGDGVNVSNFSRRKLGDIEFANVDLRKAIALEAHGGHLSLTYVQDHARSLSRIIEQRLDESWAALDEPEAWTVEVLFVAHSRDSVGLPSRESVHGVNVEYKYIDYDELLDKASEDSTATQRESALDKYVISRLNADTVRESTRTKFREIIAQ